MSKRTIELKTPTRGDIKKLADQIHKLLKPGQFVYIERAK